MKVKQFIKILETLDPEALVMTSTQDETGIQMVEASVMRDLRSGDAEIYPSESDKV